MRRLLLLPVLLAGLALVPAAAQAATPGVNIAGRPTVADLDQAQATGAKFVRVFVSGIETAPDAPLPGADLPAALAWLPRRVA